MHVFQNLCKALHNRTYVKLTIDEWRELITICDNLSDRVKFSPATPFAFTEQGVAMLSSILNSERAVAVNIKIMRIFTRIRQMLMDNTELRLEISEIKHAIEKINKKQEGQDLSYSSIYLSITSKHYIFALTVHATLPIRTASQGVSFAFIAL